MQLDELKKIDQWVGFKIENRDGKPTKPPYDPKTGKRAKVNDPGSWSDYQTALTSVDKFGFAGLGFVFTKEAGIVGIDLDKCRCHQTGNIKPWASELVSRFDSYSEISPSGKGVHILVEGNIPEGRKNGSLELYDSKRYFTFTGNHLPDSPLTIKSRQQALNDTLGEYFGIDPGEKPEPKKEAPQRLFLEDAEIINKARNAKNGAKFEDLHNGNWEAHYPGKSMSEADVGYFNFLRYWGGG